MKKKDVINIFILILVITFAAITYYNRTYTSSKSRFLMDTIVNIKITTKDKNVDSIIDTAFELIEEYNNMLSFYSEESELWKFNNSVIQSFPMDEELLQIYHLSKKLFEESESLYDITIGALSELWDFDTPHIPAADSIKIALKNVGFQRVSLEGVLLVKPEGLKINLGSLAKGFIIDRVVDFLISENVKSGIVNAGGDIRIFGNKKPAKIGIQHPRKEKNKTIEILYVENKAVVTSGDYERFFEIDGKRYHHILNPKTGYPVENTVSVTVIAPSTLWADAYATALFLMEPDKAIALVNDTDNLEAIIFYKDGVEIKRIESKGMGKYVIP